MAGVSLACRWQPGQGATGSRQESPAASRRRFAEAGPRMQRRRTGRQHSRLMAVCTSVLAAGRGRATGGDKPIFISPRPSAAYAGAAEHRAVGTRLSAWATRLRADSGRRGRAVRDSRSSSVFEGPHLEFSAEQPVGRGVSASRFMPARRAEYDGGGERGMPLVALGAKQAASARARSDRQQSPAAGRRRFAEAGPRTRWRRGT